jgi:hypothetical protein
MPSFFPRSDGKGQAETVSMRLYGFYFDYGGVAQRFTPV